MLRCVVTAPDRPDSNGSATGRTAWARSLASPVRDFLGAEEGGAAVLVAAVVAALLWANVSPASYESVWTTRLALSLGDHVLATDLRGWVDQGLMTLFFLVVGLEAKRELDLGELRERRRLAIPVVGALGGMACAVAVYLAINVGGDGAHGWGVAISTDTALALGALSLVAPRGATRLRVFLLTLVVIDDLVALVVIAVAYSERIDIVALAVALALFGVLIALRFAGRWRAAAAVLASVGIWLAMFESGVDPVIAGLAIGLITTAYPPGREELERTTEVARAFREQPTPALADSAQRSFASAVSPNERLQYRLHPWTSFVVVPLFALANAGIDLGGGLLGDAIRSPITIGVVLAYAAGKPAGILLASWLGTRRGAQLALTWPGLSGTAAVAGIGFTVSLLIAGLAFTGSELDEAKLGVLGSAIVSPLIALAIFRAMEHIPDTVRARQLQGTADQIIDLADDVDPERDHVRGVDDAPITLVEYGDFECPYCGQAEPIIRELLSACDDDLRFVFRHLPLSDVHPHAQMAAEAAEAAAAQGAFWAMHDLLFAHQDELTARALRSYADELGLDPERFSDELRRRRHAARVRDDVATADASGVTGTPTFFINGRRHYGAYDTASLLAAVRSARAAARLAVS
jgi:Na+/H+ antiporter NhaA